MKKIISCVILLALCVAAFAACSPAETKDGLTSAKDFLYTMYKDKAEATPSDFERVSVLSVDGVSYTVEWTAEVSSGSADGVKIVANDSGKTVTVDVDEKASEEIVYVLKATVKDADGKTAEVTFNHKVPAFKELSWAEYVAAADDSTVVCKGVITAIMAKSKGNSSNCIYMQDSDGGYYAYNMSADPVTECNLEVGMTVRVSGTRDTYSGTYEIMNGVVEIVDANKTAVTPVDFTDRYTKASTLKDTELTAQQGMLVTIKGVEVTGEDLSGGYFKFKLGELESYVRISSSVCPLTKEDQTTFKEGHAAHLGWTANVTGIICLYDGAFYLTPATVDAFEYVSLPAKDDAGMVAFEKDALSLTDAVTEDTEIELDKVGKSYSGVSITWSSDNACAVVSDGKLTVKLPDAETTVKITATLKCGSVTETKVFEIKVDALPTNVYVATPVTSPVKDSAYRFFFEQVNLGKTLYFTGEMNGNYFATSDKADKAADVYLEAVEGGYRLYCLDGTAKKYLDIYEYTTGKVGVRLTDTPSAVYRFDESMGILIANVLDADYYLGTYKTFDTISASKTTYITGDNAANVGVSQFVAKLCTLSAAQYKATPVTSPVKDTAYKFSLEQVSLGKTLYFTGEMNGNYFATSDKSAKAADVYLEAVEGGYRLYCLDGTAKKYLDIYEYTTGKVGVRLTDTPSAVYRFDESMGILIANVLDADYYLGTYKTFDTISASKTTYITGDNAANVGVSQFVARLVTLELSAG